MKTQITLSNPWRVKTFTVTGRPSEVSDQVVRIKRAFGFKHTHGTQLVTP